jgi:acyl dehydratase
MSDLVYLEDLRPGMHFTGGPVTVSSADIKAFAAHFDPQPFHLDEAAGEASFFKGFAASGWHTAALAMRMMVTGGPRLAAGYIGAGGDIAWKKPVYAGDTPTLRAEFVEIRPSRDIRWRSRRLASVEFLNHSNI